MNLAPNGKPSNLTPEQYRLVRTPAFKKWFGDWELLYQYKDRYTYEGHDRLFDKPKIGNEYDLVDGTKAKLLSLDKEKGQYEVLINGKKQFISFSKMLYLYSGIPDVFTEERLSEISKVVDENGEPLVVYHGTKPNRYEFNVFEIYNEGAFFTETEYVAKRYSSNYSETEFGEIKALFLNIRKPEFIKSVKYKYDGYSGADANLKKRSEKMKEKYPEFKNTPYKYKDLVREQSEKKGYDGFILENHSWGERIDNTKQYAVFNPNQIKLADGTNTTFDSNNPDIRYKKGGSVNLSKTPAPKKDRIYGSSKNKPKSSESKSKASSIILNPTVIKSINTILKEHNEDFPKKKIPLSTAKAVVRRGMGAFSSSYRPTISGGKPNSRVAWGLARLKAFVYKIQKGYSKSGKYKQDNDLIEELGYKYKEYKNGGEMELDNLYKEHHEVWAISEEIIKNVCEENCSKYSTEIYNLYETDLKAHFVEEEQVFFPSVINERNKDLIKELIREHHLIKFLVQKIRLSKRTKDIKDFCNLMIEHIRKEELIMKTISNDPYKDMAFKNGGKIPNFDMAQGGYIFKEDFYEPKKNGEIGYKFITDEGIEFDVTLSNIDKKSKKATLDFQGDYSWETQKNKNPFKTLKTVSNIILNSLSKLKKDGYEINTIIYDATEQKGRIYRSLIKKEIPNVTFKTNYFGSEEATFNPKELKMEGGMMPPMKEEYKYFLVIKNQKPVFKVKFSEYRKETERDMSEMLDKLHDMDYSLKPITEQEYKDFDYSTVDKEDIAEFTKNWSYYKNGGKITDERKETYKKWKGLVNMSSSELNKFLDSEEGKVAGLSRKEANELGIDYGRESARWILRMKDTPYSEWTPNMWRWAKKQISFISRMSGNKGKLFDENGKRTRKYLSLLVWGNNPLKK
jgi:hypothetical protein